MLALSVACKAPGALTSSRYRVLFAGKQPADESDDDYDETEESDVDANLQDVIYEMFEEGKDLIREKITDANMVTEEDEQLFR